MIQSKKDYLYYLECDKVAMRKTRKHPAYKHDIIWTFERLLRKCEYYENCKKDPISRIYAKFLKLRYVNLSQKLGFSIGFNTCGPGLCLEHYGNIGINQHAKIGCNCRIIGGVVIGATESNKVPTIGDNVFIGFGAAIVGAVTIADGVAIGANAVVSKDILIPDITVGGIPAKVISQKGSDKYLVKATEIVKREMNIKKSIKEYLKPYYYKLQRLCRMPRRIGLNTKDFTIISNNCSGGYVYQYFGITYNTPTEGLFFTADDYIKLIQRPEYYFKHEVVLIDSRQSEFAKAGNEVDYPVGKIDDIEVYFMHYRNPEEALNKWYRRASRMNFNKLFFLFTETQIAKESHIRQFSETIKRIGEGNGVCLTMKDYRLPYTCYVPNVPINKTNGNAAWKPEIVISSINWKKELNRL